MRADGDCLVLGTVMDGARMKVEGSLRVEGGIESAEVTVGGSVEILRGVSGNGGGIIRAGGDLRARFLDHATVSVAGDLVVETSILHCTLRADGDVRLTSGRGIIAGGRVVCGGNMEAGIIGGAFGTDTYVSAGLAPEELQELEDLFQRRGELARELVQARSTLRLAKGQEEKVKRAKYRLLCLSREARQADEARASLFARMRPRPNAMVLARMNLRAGVHGRISGVPYSVARDSGPARVFRRGVSPAIWPTV